MDYIFNWRTFRELEKHTEAAVVAGFRAFPSNIAFISQTVTGPVMLVSGRYFGVVGVQPFLGRLIRPEDDVPGGGNPVAVVGYRYWREKLGGAPDVLNQSLKVNGRPFTVIGIAPPGFVGTTVGNDVGVFLPMSFKPHLTEGWDGTDKLADYWVYLLARLKPGVTRQQAEAALNGPYRGIVEEMAATVPLVPERAVRFRQQRLTLKDGGEGNSAFRDEYRSALGILMLATGLVLLIAMANAANLLLARCAERRKELAIRGRHRGGAGGTNRPVYDGGLAPGGHRRSGGVSDCRRHAASSARLVGRRCAGFLRCKRPELSGAVVQLGADADDGSTIRTLPGVGCRPHLAGRDAG